MQGITPDVISEVRSRANILEIVAETVVLKRTGNTYKGLCPFHNEKTPSFHVNPEKGFFKCFGCGEGGDIFAFVQKVKKQAFPETVRELAARTGVQLIESNEDRTEHDRRTLMLRLYQQAAEYYRHLLLDEHQGAAARDYLYGRGIGEEIIEQFKLGYAPATWDGLLNYLCEAGRVSAETLAEAGLIRRKPETSKFFDLFRHRLMIPIQDSEGRVIAFGGRTLGDDQVKYLNSPESPIYIKGDHLFAFNQAKESIKARDGVIVTEGYFDAITAHQHGFTNTVATLGTALTERQARLLVRYTDSRRVFLCFDADAAGQKAVERGTETMTKIAEGIGIDLRVVNVPGGKDPDECLRSSDPHSGAAGFAQAVEQAQGLLDWRLNKVIAGISVASHAGRIDAARAIVPVLAQIKNAVGRGEYIRQWSNRLSVREEELLADVAQYRRSQGLNRPVFGDGQSGYGNASAHTSAGRIGAYTNASGRTLKQALRPGYLEAESKLLSLYLLSAEDYKFVREHLLEDQFLDAVHTRIKTAMEGLGSFETPEDFQFRLMDRLASDAEAGKVLVDVILKATEVARQNMPREVVLKDCRASILREKLQKESGRLRSLMMTAETEDQQAAAQTKILKLRQLELQLLPAASSDEEMNDLRRRIDAILMETVQ